MTMETSGSMRASSDRDQRGRIGPTYYNVGEKAMPDTETVVFCHPVVYWCSISFTYSMCFFYELKDACLGVVACACHLLG